MASTASQVGGADTASSHLLYAAPIALYAGCVHLEWPLTGRAQELGIIKATLCDPASSGIVVYGSAGVGKSRIAHEALAAAASSGWEIRRAIGTTSARALPLGALASWAESTGADTLQLVRGVIDALTSAPQGRPVAVGVDDAHLLDDLSAFVLHQIVQRSAAKLVLTVRDGEPIPPGVDEVWKDGNFGRLDLQPLSRDETESLLAATLGGPLNVDAARRLWTLTHGNALFIRNIVEHEVASGRLVQQDDSWQWSGEPVLPPNLVAIIESRIGALPEAIADVIDVLAVAEPLDLEVLSRITDPTAVEDADTRGLIAVERVAHSVEARVAHPLYGEVRRRHAPSTRLRRLRGLVVNELATAPNCDDIRAVVRRAALSIDSYLAPDRDLLLMAAKGAVWLADHGLGERLAQAATVAGAGAEAELIRAHALTWLGRGKDGLAVFDTIDTADLNDDEWAGLAFARAATLLGHLGDPAAAIALIEGLSGGIAEKARSSIDAYHLVHWAAMGKPQRAIDIANGLALDELPEIVGALPAMFLVVALGQAGRTSEAVAAAEAGYRRIDRALDAVGIRCCIADVLVRSLLVAGCLREAVEASDELRNHTADLPGGTHIMSTAVAGLAALGSGQLDTASAVLDGVIEYLASFGEISTYSFWIEYFYHLARTITLAMRGLTEEAVKSLVVLEDRRHPGWRFLDPDWGLARAWVAGCQGAVSEAATIALAAAELARESGQYAAEVMCLQTATQFGDRSCAARLEQLTQIVEGPRAGIAAHFAAAMNADDGTELDTVSKEFEKMGDLVAAVDAAGHAALSHRRHGRHGSALNCSTRAEALAERCGGANTPVLRQASERLPLTDREREVAMLLGEGLSSPAIARRLTLSRRTVEGHIYRAMAKTGTTSREELAALLPRRTTAQ